MAARFAQHFLVDESAIETILTNLNLAQDDWVLEIGPGRGALTKKVIPLVDKITAVEVDRRMVETLNATISATDVFQLIHQDILKFDLKSLPEKEKGGVSYKILGNLPYNLTSPILRKLTEWTSWKQALVMVQKEVGDRLCACVGTKSYGALTVGMNLSCEMERVFDLSPDSFRPRPKVDSTVVRLIRRESPLASNINQTQKVIQAAFQQRRKTILNSLSHGLNIDKEKVKKTLNEVKIPEKHRAEDIDVRQFIQLSEKLF